MGPKTTKNISTSVIDTGSTAVLEDAGDHTPRKLTFAENLILTIKVLAIAGLIMAALWGANHWTSPK